MILYASRTHSQLQQVVRELKGSAYKPRTLLMGSREQLCVHPTVSKQSGDMQNYSCKNLTKGRRCMYKTTLDDHSKDGSINSLLASEATSMAAAASAAAGSSSSSSSSPFPSPSSSPTPDGASASGALKHADRGLIGARRRARAVTRDYRTATSRSFAWIAASMRSVFSIASPANTPMLPFALYVSIMRPGRSPEKPSASSAAWSES